MTGMTCGVYLVTLLTTLAMATRNVHGSSNSSRGMHVNCVCREWHLVKRIMESCRWIEVPLNDKIPNTQIPRKPEARMPKYNAHKTEYMPLSYLDGHDIRY